MVPAYWHRWAARYQAGATLAQVAAREGVTTSAVFDALEALGIPRRSRGPTVGAHRTSAAAHQQWSELRASGWTLQRIASQSGVSKQAVSQALARRAQRASA